VLCRPHAARGKVSRMRMTGSLGRLLSKWAGLSDWLTI
jgi:hypothetical protein